MFILPETLHPIFDTFLHITDPVFHCTFIDPSTWFSLEHNVDLQVKKTFLSNSLFPVSLNVCFSKRGYAKVQVLYLAPFGSLAVWKNRALES